MEHFRLSGRAPQEWQAKEQGQEGRKIFVETPPSFCLLKIPLSALILT